MTSGPPPRRKRDPGPVERAVTVRSLDHRIVLHLGRALIGFGPPTPSSTRGTARARGPP